jgi:hypothetical protein
MHHDHGGALGGRRVQGDARVQPQAVRNQPPAMELPLALAPTATLRRGVYRRGLRGPLPRYDFDSPSPCGAASPT